MGFAQEMKDFLGAWQAGEKIKASETDRDYKIAQTDATTKKTERDNDPESLALEQETARAKLAHTKASTGAVGASTSLTNARKAALLENQALMRNGLGGDSGMLPPSMGAIPAGSGGARPAQVQPNVAATGALPLRSTIRTDADDELPAFADGGLVPDDIDDEDESVMPEGGAPAVSAQGAIPMGGGTSGATDMSAQSRRPGLEGTVSPTLVHDATRAGYEYGVNAYGLNSKPGAIRSRAQKEQLARFANGNGGLSSQEMELARKAVDPEGKMTDSQRNMAALGAVYQYQVGKGNPAGAQKVAFGMLQHFRMAATRYAAIAASAAEKGDMDLATKAALKAYANVPDGRDIFIEKSPDNPNQLVYYYTDEQGNEKAKGIVTPQQLAASAMGLATGGFDKAILQAAGERAPKQAADPNTPRRTEAGISKKVDSVNELVAKAQADYDESDAGKKAIAAKTNDPEHWGEVGDFASHLIQDNPRATPREAFKASLALNSLDKDDPGKQPFSVIDSSDDGMHTLKIGDGGLKMKVNDDQLEVIMNKRARLLKSNDARSDAEQDANDNAGPGYLERAGNVAGAVGGALGEAGTQAANIGGILGRGARDAVAGAIPEELAIRGKSAINKGVDAVSDGYNRLRNTGAIPGVDAPL